MNEIWKDIKNFEGLYQVSNLGRIKSLERKTNYIYKKGGQHLIKEKIIKQFQNKYGYLKCFLYKNGTRKTFNVHRLVAQAFIPNPNNLPQVNHKDENKKNNNIVNLEWCSNQYNAKYSKNKAVIQYDTNGKYINEYSSIIDASNITNTCYSKIGSVCQGKRKKAGGFIWKYKEVL